ncbi:hypothetical protein CIRG_06426 [Coccidioides immitis RMSCC 2394]|uniref:Uncharacterized protein n=1 Tax=Coccidioides immitis RMSCC 2394 TaxID=404692 RepID=A0A0J6YDH4_COCIT|nr:hypothetical protein CIRG_06426 [Coccidioides immitis RMSCC 2394]
MWLLVAVEVLVVVDRGGEGQLQLLNSYLQQERSREAKESRKRRRRRKRAAEVGDEGGMRDDPRRTVDPKEFKTVGRERRTRAYITVPIPSPAAASRTVP